MRLEKRQWNALFEEIAACGLDPRECIPTNRDNWPDIQHKLSGSFIAFSPPEASSHWRVRRKVGDGNVTEAALRSGWAAVLTNTKAWAKEVVLPDFWSELANFNGTFSSSQYVNMDNTPLTPTEQAEITAQLREITDYVEKTYSLSREQMKVLRERFKEAEAASKRIGRKDWLLLFSGTLLTLIISGILTPEIMQHILIIGLHSFGHLFGFDGPSRPQIPPA
jgi:hypothetical protein